MIKVNIHGMSCQHCVRAVTEALSRLDGVSNVQVSLEEKQASFEAPQGFDMEKVKKAVEKEGFKVV
ncbi:heavy-metal-associated domain-containing protein [Desulfonatronovibrio hydrogenovorans]|uniref:heavy-metal-associated domain-containing protein n=1 Tax=Desulfonatronovibrio hydrogenovorans TaxID=53245 RepID=UPI00048DE1E7|nr:heavy metal-associated domain-containing protein [Desulfonatronovibrio hydrogenovorans]